METNRPLYIAKKVSKLHQKVFENKHFLKLMVICELIIACKEVIIFAFNFYFLVVTNASFSFPASRG